MPALVNLDGRLLPPEQALVPVLDRGFLYGDSVYEVVRTYGGRVFAWERHYARLQRTAARLWLSIPGSAELRAEVDRTLHAAGNAESYVRVVITRGEGEKFGLAPQYATSRRVVVLVKPLELPAPEAYEKGLHLAVVRVRRNDPRTLDPALKTGNYLNNVQGLGEALASGADDAVFLDLDDRVTECSTSNVFFVQSGVVVTPPLRLGLLEGVTRGLLLEWAREDGLLVREEPHGPGALASADEVFVTSTLREVLPVTRLSFLEDHDPKPRPVGDGTPGPITRRLLSLFRARAAQGVA